MKFICLTLNFRNCVHTSPQYERQLLSSLQLKLSFKLGLHQFLDLSLVRENFEWSIKNFVFDCFAYISYKVNTIGYIFFCTRSNEIFLSFLFWIVHCPGCSIQKWTLVCFFRRSAWKFNWQWWEYYKKSQSFFIRTDFNKPDRQICNSLVISSEFQTTKNIQGT